MLIIKYSLFTLLLLVIGAVIGYRLHPKCNECKPVVHNIVTEVVQPDGTKTIIKENKPTFPPLVKPKVDRYSLGLLIGSKFDRLGASFSYRPFESIPISAGIYWIPTVSSGLSITFTF